VVKNPTQQDILNNISAAQAAAKEAAFFATDAVFGASSDLSKEARSRFGIDALRTQLSNQLVELTKRELPNMQTAVTRVLDEVSGVADRAII
jgi:hypothetical protein